MVVPLLGIFRAASETWVSLATAARISYACMQYAIPRDNVTGNTPELFRNQERQLRTRRTRRRSEADLFGRWASRLSRRENRRRSRASRSQKQWRTLLSRCRVHRDAEHTSWKAEGMGKTVCRERETRQHPRRKMIRRFKCIYLARRRAGARTLKYPSLSDRL